eukprot:1851518-Pleurochrysis_carterae.AAC.1
MSPPYHHSDSHMRVTSTRKADVFTLSTRLRFLFQSASGGVRMTNSFRPCTSEDMCLSYGCKRLEAEKAWLIARSSCTCNLIHSGTADT